MISFDLDVLVFKMMVNVWLFVCRIIFFLRSFFFYIVNVIVIGISFKKVMFEKILRDFYFWGYNKYI